MAHDKLAELQGYRNERAGLREDAKPGRIDAVDAEISRVEGDLRGEAAGLRRAEAELRSIGHDGQADAIAARAAAIEAAVNPDGGSRDAGESKPRERAVRKPAGEKA
mgnify:CR=1 FL=1